MESKSLGVGYYRVNTAEVVAKRVSSTLGTPETVRLCSQNSLPEFEIRLLAVVPLSASWIWVHSSETFERFRRKAN